MKKPTTTARLNEMLQQLLDLQARTDTLEIQLDITNDFVWAVCAMVDPLLGMIPADKAEQAVQHLYRKRTFFADSEGVHLYNEARIYMDTWIVRLQATYQPAD